MSASALITAFGYGALAVLLLKLLHVLYGCVYVFSVAAPRDLRRLAGGRWAVVTGGTDGIGRAYAAELARRGFSLLLVSRSAAKLEAVAAELRAECGVPVRTLAFDFTSTSAEEYETRLLAPLDRLDVGVLVNNVGLSHHFPDEFAEMAGGAQRHRDVLHVNTLPVTLLCHRVLRQMKARRAGVLVNLSSSICRADAAYWAVYGASKRYVVQLSAALRKEYARHGVTVQCVSPMMVSTNMSKVRKASRFCPTAADYARQAVRTIGLAAETTGFQSHEFQAFALFRLLPEFAFDLYWDGLSLTVRDIARRKMAKLQST